MISVHTSPLDQPGVGDAGGMNVYMLELARRLADSGLDIEIFTRATSSAQPKVVEAYPGVRVHHIVAGPFEGLDKQDLPGQLCDFAHGMLRTEAFCEPGWYDLVHSHYWLSGKVGAAIKGRLGVPLVHTMHTMAKVKNALLAEGDRPEPPVRVLGEEQVVSASDRLIANTDEEARQLRELYGAPSDRIAVVHPGVDVEAFSPGDQRQARERLGIGQDAIVLAFAGRVQPLKAPDLLLHAAERLVRRAPDIADRLLVAVIGGRSGEGSSREQLATLARDLGIADRVRFVPPQPQRDLAEWYRAATVVTVPSYNESFGLVALEAQACGTPVVAAATGGLPTAVAEGRSGVLLDGHDPEEWAQALDDLLADPARLSALGAGAVEHARRFGWTATAARTLEVYDAAAARSPAIMSR